jgi:hypothetical protein
VDTEKSLFFITLSPSFRWGRLWPSPIEGEGMCGFTLSSGSNLTNYEADLYQGIPDPGRPKRQTCGKL